MSNFVLLCWIIMAQSEEKKKAVKKELYGSKLLKAIFVIQSQNHLQLYSGELKNSLNFCLLGIYICAMETFHFKSSTMNNECSIEYLNILIFLSPKSFIFLELKNLFFFSNLALISKDLYGKAENAYPLRVPIVYLAIQFLIIDDFLFFFSRDITFNR